MIKARPTPLETVDDALVDAAALAIGAAGAVPIKKLCAQPLSRRAQLMLFEALERRGFERTPKVVRVALEKQLDELVAREGRVPLKGLKKRLLGCTSDAEAKRAAIALGLAGRALWLQTDTSEALAPVSAPVLASDETAALAELGLRLTKLSKRLKPAKGQPPRSVERAFVAELLQALPQDASPAGPADALGAVIAALQGAKESVFVPELVRQLASRVPSARVKELLLLAARSGRVELRPESGIGLLSAEDRELCPITRDGTPLSYVRLTD